MLAAAALGKVRLRNAPPAGDPPQEWGLAARSLGAFEYRDATVRYSWKPGGADAAPTAPGGFCGRGPDDDFAWYVAKCDLEGKGIRLFAGCYDDKALLLEEDAVQAIYERRR